MLKIKSLLSVISIENYVEFHQQEFTADIPILCLKTFPGKFARRRQRHLSRGKSATASRGRLEGKRRAEERGERGERSPLVGERCEPRFEVKIRVFLFQRPIYSAVQDKTMLQHVNYLPRPCQCRGRHLSATNFRSEHYNERLKTTRNSK